MKRQIFYIGGFDPRGVRFYYNLCKEQVDCWQSLYKIKATIGKKEQVDNHVSKWDINTEQGLNLEYNFLHWDDIIRSNWIRKPHVLLWQAIKTYYGFIRNSNWKFIRKITA